MFVRDAFTTRNPVPLDHSFTDLRQFIGDYQPALANAASLLAGRKGLRLVDLIVDGLQHRLAPSPRTMHALNELLSILSLGSVHDEMSDESGFFAMLDPADPIVSEICLLTDGLRDVLQAVPAGGTELDQDLIVS